MSLNPTSRLPRLKTQPTITQLLEALELLGRIYAPSLRFQISAQRTNQDANQNATEVEEIDSIQIVRNDEIERRFAKNWLTMMIGSGLPWIEEEETEENQDEHSASASASAPSDNRSRDNGKWTASDLVDLAGNILASEARVEGEFPNLERLPSVLFKQSNQNTSCSVICLHLLYFLLSQNRKKAWIEPSHSLFRLLLSRASSTTLWISQTLPLSPSRLAKTTRINLPVTTKSKMDLLR